MVFVNTNRGFNPNSPLLRNNVDFKLTTPNEAYREDRLKKEWWGNATDVFQNWRRNK